METEAEETWGWGGGAACLERKARRPKGQGEEKPGGWTPHGVGVSQPEGS